MSKKSDTEIVEGAGVWFATDDGVQLKSLITDAERPRIDNVVLIPWTVIMRRLKQELNQRRKARSQ